MNKKIIAITSIAIVLIVALVLFLFVFNKKDNSNTNVNEEIKINQKKSNNLSDSSDSSDSSDDLSNNSSSKSSKESSNESDSISSSSSSVSNGLNIDEEIDKKNEKVEISQEEATEIVTNVINNSFANLGTESNIVLNKGSQTALEILPSLPDEFQAMRVLNGLNVTTEHGNFYIGDAGSQNDTSAPKIGDQYVLNGIDVSKNENNYKFVINYSVSDKSYARAFIVRFNENKKIENIRLTQV